jgi:signal transduction histidine kinase
VTDSPADDLARPPLFSRRLRRKQLIALDGLAAAGFWLVQLNFALLHLDEPNTAPPLWLTLLLAAVTALPLAVRRLWPVAVFTMVGAGAVATVVGAGAVATMAIGPAYGSFAAAAYALYPVALTVRTHSWVPTTAIGVVSVLGLLVLSLGGPVGGSAELITTVTLGAMMLGASWTLGRAIRDRRAFAARSARRLAEQRVAEERLHIARELHDVVAHSMSLIAVKASVANHVAKKRPEEAFDALAVIEDTSKSALTEMRRILGMLRDDGDEADLAPAPGLGDLPELVERAALAGVRVSIRSVEPQRLPTGVGLSAYRIVQEAITNVVKHAAPADCEVDITDDDATVRITVSDNGPGTRVLPSAPGGHGLVGMAERVAMYHGRFSAGPGESGGFTVTASLPYRDAPVETV